MGLAYQNSLVARAENPSKELSVDGHDHMKEFRYGTKHGGLCGEGQHKLSPAVDVSPAAEWDWGLSIY